MSRPSGRRVIAVAAYACVCAFGIVATLELAVRVAGIAPPLDPQYGNQVSDPWIPFKPRPLSTTRGRAAGGEFEFSYEHNSLGFRDGEHAEAKPQGTFRIVALGDSFTYGAAAAFEETYPSRLERQLNERPDKHAQVEVINLGLPRYFPEVERYVLAHYGLRYHPDLVLIGVLPNDVLDTHLGVGAVTVSPSGYLLSRQGARWGEAAVWLYVHSHLMRILLARWAVSATQPGAIRDDDIYKDNGFYEADWVAMESDLEDIRRLAHGVGAPLVIVAIPQRGPWKAWSAYPEQRLARWSAAHGAIFVPTLTALAAASTTEHIYWEHDGHCTGAGYGVIATAIFETLTQRHLVP